MQWSKNIYFKDWLILFYCITLVVVNVLHLSKQQTTLTCTNATNQNNDSFSDFSSFISGTVDRHRSRIARQSFFSVEMLWGWYTPQAKMDQTKENAGDRNIVVLSNKNSNQELLLGKVMF